MRITHDFLWIFCPFGDSEKCAMNIVVNIVGLANSKRADIFLTKALPGWLIRKAGNC